MLHQFLLCELDGGEQVDFRAVWKKCANGECNADVLGGGANNSSNLHELLAEAEALLKQPRRATDPVLQQALEICNVHSGVNIPLKANEYEMRQMMQSFAASGVLVVGWGRQM